MKTLLQLILVGVIICAGTVYGQTTYVPTIKVDSSYDPEIPQWFVVQDSIVAYNQTNCLDSIEVSFNSVGTYLTRSFYGYHYFAPSTYQGNELDQVWDSLGHQWVNSSQYETGGLANAGCFFDHDYALNWNGSAWDTITGSQRTVTADYNSANEATLIVRQAYQSNLWSNYSTWSFSYDVNNRMTSQTYSLYDNTTDKFVPQWRDTNLVYSNYANMCDYAVFSYVYQTWSGAAWQTSYKNTYTTPAQNLYRYGVHDTIYSFNWNGSVYDTTSIEIVKGDSYGNEVSDITYDYDSTAHAWSLIEDYSVDSLTYGPHNEVVRDENYTNDNRYAFSDSIFPSDIFINSDFISCTSTAGISEIAAPIGMRVSPNPLTSSSLVEFDAELKDAKADIYDLPGKKIRSEVFSGKSLVLQKGSLSDGIYFLRVNDGERQYVQKIIVQ